MLWLRPISLLLSVFSEHHKRNGAPTSETTSILEQFPAGLNHNEIPLAAAFSDPGFMPLEEDSMDRANIIGGSLR